MDNNKGMPLVTLLDASLGQTIAALNDKYVKMFDISFNRKTLIEITLTVLRDKSLSDADKIERLNRLQENMQEAVKVVN